MYPKAFFLKKVEIEALIRNGKVEIRRDSHPNEWGHTDVNVGEVLPPVANCKYGLLHASYYNSESKHLRYIKIVSIWPQKLKDMTKKQAMAAGVTKRGKLYCMDWSPVGKPSGHKNLNGDDIITRESHIANDNPVGAFATYWESIYGSDAWDKNPKVWVIEVEAMKGKDHE